MTTIETLPAGDVTQTGELLGDVRGVRFYRLAVIAAVLPDGRVDRIESEADWGSTLEAELLAARARIAELERRKSGPKPGTRRPLALPAPRPDPAPVAPPAPEIVVHVAPPPAPNGRFGNEAIAPRVPPPPVATPPPERHPCAQCGRIFDSQDKLDRHTCRPVETPPALPVHPAPATPTIPEDPAAAAKELKRLSTTYPRPCPECWAQGVVMMVKGPAGMGSHRSRIHGVIPNVGNPIPVRWPDGGVCKHCGSGVFARSFDDETVCVKCAKEGPPA